MGRKKSEPADGGKKQHSKQKQQRITKTQYDHKKRDGLIKKWPAAIKRRKPNKSADRRSSDFTAPSVTAHRLRALQ